MPEAIRALILDDSEKDARDVVRHLRKAGYNIKRRRVHTQAGFKKALKAGPWDVLIADYELPCCKRLQALQVMQEGGYEIPLVLISGEEVDPSALEAMKAGAHGYVLKENLEEVVAAVEHAVHDAEEIRKRKHTEAELAETHELYRSVVDSSLTGIIIIQYNHIVFANPTALELTGFTWDEADGATAWDFIHPADRKETKKRYEKRVKGHKAPDHYEVKVIVKSGEVRQFDVRASAIQYRGRPAVLDTFIDVTERRRAEAALRTSEERLNLALEAANDGIWDWNVPTGEAYFSPRYYTMLGYEPDEFPASYDTWKSLLHPDDLGPTLEAIHDYVYVKRTGYALEFRMRTKTGQWRWILSRGQVMERDKDGAPIRMLGTHTDITDRKAAEEALRFTQFAVDRSSMAAFWLHSDGRFLYVNDAACQSLGYTLRQLQSMAIHDIDPDFPPEAWPEHWKKLKRLGSLNFESRHRRKDGTILPVEISANYMEFEGNEYNCAFALDITERKESEQKLRDSEQRYRILFERSPDMVFVLKNGVFVTVNPAITSTLGYKHEEIIGKHPWEISPERQPDGKSSKQKARQLIERAIERRPQTFDWVHTRKDGSLADCEVRLVSYRVHGELYVQAIVRDITEKKRVEENRRKLERRVEAQKRKFYRDTILSVTDGKLDICDSARIKPYLSNTQKEISVCDAAEVSSARKEVEEFCLDAGMDGERLSSYLVGIGEAITNAVKHGGEGQVYAGAADGEVWTAVSDKGEGIESLILPQATLQRGFSTKPSMGLGYSIMLEVADQVLLKTGRRGTTVVLVKTIQEKDETLSVEDLPDTWENIKI